MTAIRIVCPLHRGPRKLRLYRHRDDRPECKRLPIKRSPLYAGRHEHAVARGRGGPMQLSPSAHVDTFTRDNLPPPERRPDFIFELPELAYPARLNCADKLLDRVVERLRAQ